MKILLAELQKSLQDQVHVALEQFEGFEVECAQGVDASDRIRRCDYDWVFLEIKELGPTDPGRVLLNALVEDSREATLFVLSDKTQLSKLKEGPERTYVSAYLASPPTPLEFYKLIARFRNRATAS